ncbi:MAG: 30S ribosomal protein S4 [Thermoplasmata archaeon]|nr:30S ribosomal protein S4 [Thermoplasmata archaeon]
MGDPKFKRRKWESPKHPWEKERFKEEAELLKKFGLKNKRELWKAKSLLRRFRHRARILQAQLRYGEEQAEKEKKELIEMLWKFGLVKENASLDDILALDLDAVLNRRLQTMTFKKGIAFTHRHARQLITHGHVAIAGRKVTIPSYLMKRNEEESIEYNPTSPYTNEAHPSRPKPEEQMMAQEVAGVEEKKSGTEG